MLRETPLLLALRARSRAAAAGEKELLGVPLCETLLDADATINARTDGEGGCGGKGNNADSEGDTAGGEGEGEDEETLLGTALDAEDWLAVELLLKRGVYQPSLETAGPTSLLADLTKVRRV